MIVDQKAKLRKKCQKTALAAVPLMLSRSFTVFLDIWRHPGHMASRLTNLSQAAVHPCNTSETEAPFDHQGWQPHNPEANIYGWKVPTEFQTFYINLFKFINKWWQLAPKCHDIWIWMTLLWLSNMMNVMYDSCIQPICLPGDPWPWTWTLHGPWGTGNGHLLST